METMRNSALDQLSLSDLRGRQSRARAKPLGQKFLSEKYLYLGESTWKVRVFGESYYIFEQKVSNFWAKSV